MTNVLLRPIEAFLEGLVEIVPLLVVAAVASIAWSYYQYRRAKQRRKYLTSGPA